MLEFSLSVLVLLGSGVVAGVLFAVALSIVPALTALPASLYVEMHTLIGRRWDPTMPLLVVSSMAVDVGLAILTPEERVWYLAAAVALLGVAVVSHFGNVPLNRAVKSVNPDELPSDWSDPRPTWRRWHLIRTALALVGLAANAIAVAGL